MQNMQIYMQKNMQNMQINMQNMHVPDMQNNMQNNMQNMQAICSFGPSCRNLPVICKICKIICPICKICIPDFNMQQYATICTPCFADAVNPSASGRNMEVAQS